MVTAEFSNVSAIAASAEAAMARGDTDAASAEVRGGLSVFPTDTVLLTLAEKIFAALHGTNVEHLELRSASLLADIGSWLLSEKAASSAEVFLREAVARDDKNNVYRHLWLSSLNQSGRQNDVLSVSLRRIKSRQADIDEFIQAISASLDENKPILALLLQKRARRTVGDHPYFDTVRLHALVSLKRFEESRLYLNDNEDSADLLFIGSIVHASLGEYTSALNRIELARLREPDNVIYANHHIAVLGSLGRHREAADIYDRLATEHISELPALRSAFAVYAEAGRYDSAVRIGAMIVQQTPDDFEFLAIYQTVLGKNVYANLLQSSVRQDLKPVSINRVQPSSPTIRYRFRLTRRSILALIHREMKTRFGRSRLGYLWVIFEPLAHIGIMILLIQTMSHGGLPPIGTSFAVFYFTGIVPFHMFTHTAGHLIGAAAENRPLLQIPRVKLPDIFIARAILEGITELIVSAILITLFLLAGMNALPIDPLGVLGALALLWIAAFGIGMINAAINSVFAGWERIWGAATSVIYFTSGTFYIPRMMPPWLRDILVWNPVLQTIELVRLHYFHEPRPEWLSVTYLSGLAIALLGIGFTTERLMRRRMLDIE